MRCLREKYVKKKRKMLGDDEKILKNLIKLFLRFRKSCKKLHFEIAKKKLKLNDCQENK
jgi:hypothetical protein